MAMSLPSPSRRGRSGESAIAQLRPPRDRIGIAAGGLFSCRAHEDPLLGSLPTRVDSGPLYDGQVATAIMTGPISLILSHRAADERLARCSDRLADIPAARANRGMTRALSSRRVAVTAIGGRRHRSCRDWRHSAFARFVQRQHRNCPRAQTGAALVVRPR